MKKIIDDSDYKEIMEKIDCLMAKGSNNVSREELLEIRAMAEAVQAYEQTKYAIDESAF